MKTTVYKKRVSEGLTKRELIIQYLKDSNGHIWATLVATRDGIGVSIRNSEDKKIDKFLGVDIAWQRAKEGYYTDRCGHKIPRDKIMKIHREETKITSRAMRYFRELNFQNNFDGSSVSDIPF